MNSQFTGTTTPGEYPSKGKDQMKTASFLSLVPLINRGKCQSQQKGIMKTKKRSADDIYIHLKNNWLTKPVIKPYAITSFTNSSSSSACTHQSKLFQSQRLFQRFMVLLCSSRVHMRSALFFLDHDVMINFHDLRLTLRLFIENATTDQ